jgi:hypothetical protein
MNRKWKTSPKVLSSKLDEEVILMSIEADSYFGVDPVGSYIWELLAKNPATIEELVIMLMDEYEVDENTCKNDVEFFISEMSTRNLIFQEE